MVKVREGVLFPREIKMCRYDKKEMRYEEGLNSLLMNLKYVTHVATFITNIATKFSLASESSIKNQKEKRRDFFLHFWLK